MKKLLMSAALCLCLPACAMLSHIPTSPHAAAQKTVLDERLLGGVEVAYKASRLTLEFAVDNNLIPAERKAIWQARNRKAYAAVQAVEDAYRTGNSAGYIAAYDNAQQVIKDFTALMGSK